MTQNNQKYAIIETGGKQYRVEEGGIVDVELLELKTDLKFNLTSSSSLTAPR